MSPSEILIRGALLLAPAVVAALGGFLAFHVRLSTVKACAVQLTTAFILIGLALGSYLGGLPSFFWILHLLLVLPCIVQFVAKLFISVKLTNVILAPRRWDLGLLALSPILLACAFSQLDCLAAPDIFEPEPEAILLTREAAESAYTDRGRQIHLFELRPESRDSFALTGDKGLLMSGTPAPYRAIRMTEPDGASNCVGWTFVGAHYLMQCSDVNTILEDNDYQVVKKPRVGDLVIYRDLQENVTHAGCVAQLLDGGQPLIESKWGYQGLFLHLPEGSPFGSQWTYYRSPRANRHSLQLRPRNIEPGTQSVSENSP